MDHVLDIIFPRKELETVKLNERLIEWGDGIYSCDPPQYISDPGIIFEQIEDVQYFNKIIGEEPRGVSGFADEVTEFSSSYTPKAKKIELEGFEKREISSYYCDENYSSIDVVNLLVKGDLKTEFISQKWYCIYRNETIEETMGWLPQKKVVILQSKLGNGKSVFLECLAYHLLEKYNVYVVKNLDSLYRRHSAGAKRS